MVYETRQGKLITLREIVKQCNTYSLPALKEKLIAFCGKEWGTARQTAQAMLKELVANEEIVIDNEEVWLWKRWQKILNARQKDYLKMEAVINGQRKIS